MVGLAIGWLTGTAMADPDGTASGRETAVTPAVAPVARDGEDEGDPSSLPFGDVLQRAEQWYFEGRAEEAQQWLEALQLRILRGEQPPWDEVVEALTYLGEIQYDAGDPESAALTFRWVLEKDVETPISPYHHPLEVVNLFELVRNTVRTERAAAVPAPPPTAGPAPAWVWLPFGAPQLLQRRGGAAVLYGGLQVGLASTAIGMYVHLATYNQDQAIDLTTEERTQHVQLRRYAIQWPATFGFYGAWALSSTDATLWHRRHPGVRVSLLPSPPAAQDQAWRLVATGRF